MRAAVLSALGLMACAAPGPEVAVCEESIQARLAPGTAYRRVSVTSQDTSPIPIAEFRRRSGTSEPWNEPERLRAVLDDEQARLGRLGLRETTIAYEIDGRSAQAVCRFRLREGVVEDADAIRSRQRLRRGEDVLSELDGQPARAADDCCL